MPTVSSRTISFNGIRGILAAQSPFTRIVRMGKNETVYNLEESRVADLDAHPGVGVTEVGTPSALLTILTAVDQAVGASVGDRAPSTNISGAGVNAGIGVEVDGGALTPLTIPNPAAFDYGLGVLALNTSARIVAALNFLALGAGLGLTFGYDLRGRRYYAYSSTGGVASSVVISAGLLNNIADDLKIGLAAGGIEVAGCASRGAYQAEAMSRVAPQAVGTTELRDGALSADATGRLKMADDYLTDLKLNSDRGKYGALSISADTPITDISANGANSDLQVVDGDGVTTVLTIPDPSAFDLGSGAVPLNTGDRIAQALTILAAAAGIPFSFAYDAASVRYVCYSTARVTTTACSLVNIFNGPVNDVTVDLKLGVAGGGVELPWNSNLDYNLEILMTRVLDLAQAAPLPGSITTAMLSFEPVKDNGVTNSFCAHFIGAFPQNQTIQIDMGDVWTGAAASNPSAREFLSGVGAAADLASFVAAVNDPLSPSVGVAANAYGNTCIVVGKLRDQSLFGFSSHANCVISNETSRLEATDKSMSEGRYTVDDAGVDIGFLGAGDCIVIGTFYGTPFSVYRLKSISCLTATGAIKVLATVVFSFVNLGDGRTALTLQDSGAVIANGDQIDWMVVFA